MKTFHFFIITAVIVIIAVIVVIKFPIPYESTFVIPRKLSENVLQPSIPAEHNDENNSQAGIQNVNCPFHNQNGFGGFGNLSPDQFFACGGRSFVVERANNNENMVTIGSTVLVTITLTHKTSANPLPSVTLHYSGIMNKFVLLVGQNTQMKW